MQRAKGAGRPTAIGPDVRSEMRSDHMSFIRKWMDKLGVSENTVRRALAYDTKKGSDDSTVTSP